MQTTGTGTSAQRSPGGPRPSPLRRLWYRNLDHYPAAPTRAFFLGIVIVSTILLYYQYYVPTGVSTLILSHLHMSFRFYVNILVVSALVGAFASLLAGLSDRFGRANIVVYGLLLVSLLQLLAIPNASSEWVYGTWAAMVGFVEGVILVATPALVRDFTPQLGRASAMGFWTLGPVAGSLVMSIIATHTVPHLHDWQSQFIISGVVGMVVFVIALVGLRELSPPIRDQLMVSNRDRALVEARARGIDVEAATAHPWRQMFRPNLIGAAIGISVFLLIYYAAAGFFVVYFTTVFHTGLHYFSISQANGLDTWFWAFDCGALIVMGILSDVLRVRKPFMLVGALGSLVMTIVFLRQAGTPTTGYYTLAWIMVLLAIFLAVVFAPWMAAYTETVEDRNPALVATGIAVWAWIIRLVVAISFFVLPYVVSSVNPLVDNQAYEQYVPRAVAFQSAHPHLVAAAQSHQALFEQLAKYPSPSLVPPALLARAEREVGLPTLLEANQYKSDLIFLQRVSPHLLALQQGSSEAPSQWQHWYWVCVAGMVAFFPTIFLTRGRWSPRRARRDADEHERKVEEELAAITRAEAAAASGREP
jgi:MFS family permease